MNQLHDLIKTTRPTQRRRRTNPVVRTYRQIAAVFAKRTGMPSSPARIRQICQAAEVKLARALLADPVLHQWLRPRWRHS